MRGELKSYFAVRHPRLQRLNELVNSLMKEGWEPQGGIGIDSQAYHQAMVSNATLPEEALKHLASKVERDQ